MVKLLHRQLGEVKMKEKLIAAKDEFNRQIKRLSIISTLTIHLLYIGYLAYSLINDVGIKIVNLALIIGTAVFLVVYLFLQLIGQKSQIKSSKRTYKRFKLITKVFTTATAIYSLITAASSTNIIATIITAVGAGFLALRVLVEIIVALIKRKAKRFKEDFIAKRESKKMEAIEKRQNKRMEKALAKNRTKKPAKISPENTEEETPDDSCAISVEEP